MDPLIASLKVAASGLGAQSTRLRIVSENLANAQSTGSFPGAEPYQRKTITFAAELDRGKPLDHYWLLIRSIVIVMRSRACLMTCRFAS